MSDLVVVLGGSGAIGSHVVTTLMAQGRPVRAVSRTAMAEPGGVDSVTADLRDPEQVRAAVKHAAVVVHAAQPAYTRWPTEFPQLTRTIVDATAAAGARLVFADNLYSYGPVDAMLTEDLPHAATDAKGRVRTQMVQELLHRHSSGDLDVVIGRASDYYGPRGINAVTGPPLFGAVVRGKPARLIGSPDQPHSWNYLPDLARALVLLADAPQASGGIWHLPVAEPLTQRELVVAAARAADTEAKISMLPGWLHRALSPVHPMLRELWGTRYQFTAPYVVDDRRFRTEIAPFTPTSHEEAIAATVAWFAAQTRDAG